MDGDMNDIFQKLNTILEDENMSDNLKNIISNFSSSNESSNNSDSEQRQNRSNSQKSSDGFGDFDINTILKIKSIMDSFKDDSNDPRSNLLLSLKPYLADNKKEKIDQYVKFLKLAKIFEKINPLGGDNTKNE